MRRIDINKWVGKEIKGSRLVIIKEVERSRHNQRQVLCKCKCGNEKIGILSNTILRKTKSCGCLNSELTRERNISHNLSNHKLYGIFINIKLRCYNKKNDNYSYYGGRGIKICDEWLNDYGSFINWSIKNGWKENLQIDRIDNDGNYEPSNCRFVTNQEQSVNKRKYKNNTSGYIGISFNRYSYNINIKYNNKVIFNKSGFKTAKEAAITRDKFIIENGLPNQLNFPELREKL